MSFPNFDYPQGQPGVEEVAGQGATAAQQQQQPPHGQQAGNSPAPFQAGGTGDPGSAGGSLQQQGGDAKTTLWYVAFP
jgi:hypothetical protein